MKLHVLMLCCYFINSIAYSQTNVKPVSKVAYPKAEVKAGDKVPDVSLRPIGQRSFQLSSLKGKLVILDFFGVYCSSCIEHLPEMQRLQDSFGDRIKILVVTQNDSTKIRKLLSRIPLLKNISLPFITNDSLLSSYFYYASLPTHVWIDTGGVVIQKTAGYNTSYKNIEAWLAGGEVKLPSKKEFRDYQRGVPLFVEGEGRQVDKLKYYSVIMGRPEGLDGQSDVREEKDTATGNIVRVLIAQSSLMYLYRYAFAEGDRNRNFIFENGRVVLDVGHPEQFELPANESMPDNWKDQYLCSYEIKVPPERSGSIYKWMQSDLERYFGYTAAIEERKVDCWVLKRNKRFNPSDSRLPSKWEEGLNYIHATNVSLHYISDKLQYSDAFIKVPFIREFDATDKVDLNLHCTLEDTKHLAEELQKYGLLLVKEKRLIPMFVVSEIKGATGL